MIVRHGARQDYQFRVLLSVAMPPDDFREHGPEPGAFGSNELIFTVAMQASKYHGWFCLHLVVSAEVPGIGTMILRRFERCRIRILITVFRIREKSQRLMV